MAWKGVEGDGMCLVQLHKQPDGRRHSTGDQSLFSQVDVFLGVKPEGRGDLQQQLTGSRQPALKVLLRLVCIAVCVTCRAACACSHIPLYQQQLCHDIWLRQILAIGTHGMSVAMLIGVAAVKACSQRKIVLVFPGLCFIAGSCL